MNTANLDLSNDKLLLLRMEQGDKMAFDELYEKYWEKTFSLAYKRLKDLDQAKDIVQDIFLNIWLKKENRIDNLPAYLHVAVRNRVFKQVEKAKTTIPFLDLLQNLQEINQMPDEDILWQEFYAAYETLIASLPPKRQNIFRLHFHEEITTKAIAQRLGISRKTVQNQIGKAIEQLRVSIQKI